METLTKQSSVSDIRLSFRALKTDVVLYSKITTKKIKMKKIVFAIQVFGLIALFPIYEVVEVNHGMGSSSEGNSTSSIKHKTEIMNICLPDKGKHNMGNESLPVTLETFLAIKTF